MLQPVGQHDIHIFMHACTLSSLHVIEEPNKASTYSHIHTYRYMYVHVACEIKCNRILQYLMCLPVGTQYIMYKCKNH